jgi:hypothetical protein
VNVRFEILVERISSLERFARIFQGVTGTVIVVVAAYALSTSFNPRGITRFDFAPNQDGRSKGGYVAIRNMEVDPCCRLRPSRPPMPCAGATRPALP